MRRMLTSGEFELKPPIVESEIFGPTAVLAADLDNDGDLDVVSASVDIPLSLTTKEQRIAWYENTDGAGALGRQQIISTRLNEPRSLFAADADGDGDVDIFSAQDNTVAWYENLDGFGNFRRERVITRDAVHASSVHVKDLDGDGDLDVLSASSEDNTVAWYRNTDGVGDFGPKQVIADGLAGANFVSAADADADGDLDVFASSFDDDRIVWYENEDGLGNFGSQNIVTASVDGPSSIFLADFDGDANVDVLAASSNDDRISLYGNVDGTGNFGQPQEVDSTADGAISVFADDFDADGDLDIVAAASEVNVVGWYENVDGSGNFAPQRRINDSANGANAVYAADIDGDGDADVISASAGDHTISWYTNSDGAGGFGAPKTVSTSLGGAWSVFAADLDGDQDQDALVASFGDHKVSWHENMDGAGTFGQQQVITTDAEWALSVFAADIDGDHDMDVLSGSAFGTMVAWYENTNGAGAFGSPRRIHDDAQAASSVYAADIDADGDADVVTAESDSTVVWYENTDGRGDFGQRHVITQTAMSVNDVHVADVDGDGDLDVLSASYGDNTVAWYENTDGLGSFGPKTVISSNTRFAYSVTAGDVDNDGDVDVLSSFRGGAAWYENVDGEFGEPQLVTSHDGIGTSVFVIDVDLDGDVDVISSSNRGEIAWSENIDGFGLFEGQQLPEPNSRSVNAVYAADFDGDGDVDVLTGSNSGSDPKLIWYEQLGSPPPRPTCLVCQPGDANEDLRFDVLDLTQVLQAGKYATGEAATWAEGDWDGDGVFDRFDLLIALTTGNYLQGPYAIRSVDDGSTVSESA